MSPLTSTTHRRRVTFPGACTQKDTADACLNETVIHSGSKERERSAAGLNGGKHGTSAEATALHRGAREQLYGKVSCAECFSYMRGVVRIGGEIAESTHLPRGMLFVGIDPSAQDVQFYFENTGLKFAPGRQSTEVARAEKLLKLCHRRELRCITKCYVDLGRIPSPKIPSPAKSKISIAK